MRVLINGREARGPGAYVIGALAVMLVIAVLVFVVLPIVSAVIVFGLVAGAVYIGARALGLVGRRGRTLRDTESSYRIESSRRLDSHLDDDDSTRS